jgi:rubrerythrin
MTTERTGALHGLIARVTAPLAFVSRAKTARQLFRFALAEQESMLELRAAAAQTASADRRAAYLRHALDETRHAATFAAHALDIRRALGKPGWGTPRTGCEALFARLGERDFLAFVHRGEERGRAQFEAYEALFARRGDDKLRALFAAILKDEREHERYTRALLVEVAGGEDAARRALRKMAAWEAFRTWRRGGQAIARVLYLAAMTVLYVVLAPFALVVRAVRPARAGWNAPERDEG